MAYRIFLGSSSQSKKFVRDLQGELNQSKIGDEVIDPIPWTHAFDIGDGTLEGLVEEAEKSDAAIFIFAPDDLIAKSGNETGQRTDNGFYVTRDNVLFELGLFLGRLGRDRVFYVVPENHRKLRLQLPSDLNGITYATYNSELTNPMADCCIKVVNKLSASKSLPPRPKLFDAFENLRTAVKTLVDRSNTHSIGVFPTYFKSEICELVARSEKIWIASDVLTYGALSDRKSFDIYLELLKSPKRISNIIVLSGDRIPDAVKRQIPESEWRKLKECDPDFQGKLEQFEETIGALTPILTPEEFYTAVVQFQQAKIAYLRRRNSTKIKIIERNVDMPLFLWIGDDREAIFSVPIDKTSAATEGATSAFEHGFITKDPDLVRGLRATWERYAAT